MIYDADFYRRTLPRARARARTLPHDDITAVIDDALTLTGALLADPDTLWRPWSEYGDA